MANTAVIGLIFGDEGKGKMVDYLARKYDNRTITGIPPRQ